MVEDVEYFSHLCKSIYSNHAQNIPTTMPEKTIPHFPSFQHYHWLIPLLNFIKNINSC